MLASPRLPLPLSVPARASVGIAAAHTRYSLVVPYYWHAWMHATLAMHARVAGFSVSTLVNDLRSLVRFLRLSPPARRTYVFSPFLARAAVFL